MSEPLTAERLAELMDIARDYAGALMDIETCDGPEFYAADRSAPMLSESATQTRSTSSGVML